MATRQQKLAQLAYGQVKKMEGGLIEDPYARVCKNFPALIHNSGLCQAVAFAQSKGKKEDSGYGEYLKSLATILDMNCENLAEKSRYADVLTYQRLTDLALTAASWLKRYAEVLLKDETTSAEGEGKGT